MTSDDLIERLRARKEFVLNGQRWMMIPQPDTDCAEAADALAQCREKLDRLPMDWDTENDFLLRSNDVLRAEVKRLQSTNNRLCGALERIESSPDNDYIHTVARAALENL